jgi:hypothetical protein
MIKLFQEVNPSTQEFNDYEGDPFETLEDPFEDTIDPFLGGDGTLVRPSKAKLDRAKSLEYLEKIVSTSTISIEERLNEENEAKENSEITTENDDKANQEQEIEGEQEIGDNKEMQLDSQIKELGPKRNYLKALQTTPPSSPCKKVKLSTYKTIQWPVDAKLFQRGERIYYSRVTIGGEDYHVNDTIQFINFNLTVGSGYIGIIKSLYCNESSNPYEYKNFVSCQFYFYPSELTSQNSEIIPLQDSSTNELFLSDCIDVFSIDLISKKVNVHTFEEFSKNTEKDNYYCDKKYDFLSKTFV